MQQSPEPTNKRLKTLAAVVLVMSGVYYTTHNLIGAYDGLNLLGSHPMGVLWVCALLLLVAIGASFLVMTRWGGAIASKWFALAWGRVIPLVIVLLATISALVIGNASGNFSAGSGETQTNEKKIRIALILPLNESIGPAYEDGIRQVIGFAELLKDDPECTMEFEFALFDHSLKAQDAIDVVKDELLVGTDYFFCTMSNVTTELSKEFPRLVQSYANTPGRHPKLICGVTSSPNITFTDSLVYRFYIRSQEEAKALADLAFRKDFNTATFIAVDDAYGHGAVATFKEAWKGDSITPGVFVKKTGTPDEIRHRIEAEILRIPEGQRESIFICHYGNGIDNIVTALNDLRINAKLLATSTISIFEWQLPVKDILKKYEWYTCIPAYTSDPTEHNDVIKNFTTFALKRLTIACSKMSSSSNFDQCWRNATVPDNLDVRMEGMDAVIPMRAVSKEDLVRLFPTRR